MYMTIFLYIRFTTSFGIHALLDPFWIFIVDMLLLRYNAPQAMNPTADATKLYWHCQQLEKSGITGIFLTLLLYTLIGIINLACLYVYFLQVHMNGRLRDTHYRLKSPEEELFLPMDNEISLKELGYICRKSEQWRGNEGQRKKVIVTDYIWKIDKVIVRSDNNYYCYREVLWCALFAVFLQCSNCTFTIQKGLILNLYPTSVCHQIKSI